MAPFWLLERLRAFGDRGVLVWQDRNFGYDRLLRSVDESLTRLSASGVRPGDCVAVHGSYSPGTCSLLVALILNRNIFVPLSGAGQRVPGNMFEIARVRALISFDLADAWTIERRPMADDHPLLQGLRDANAPGLILSTSGSTGESKAALLNFERLLERFRRQRRALRTLMFMEPDHIGGINTLFHVLADGGTAITQHERTPQAVCRSIERHRVQLLPTTPTFLRMLLISEAYKDHDLSSLELITYGTEPMPATTLQALVRTFPSVRFKQTYGLSEIGILPTASEDSQSLWLKMGGTGSEIKIVDGILHIRAQSAMLGYLNAPSPFDADGWLNTGDVVETKGEYLRILGRASEAINVGGEKVYPAEVESVLLEMSNVSDVTVYGKRNPVTGNVVAARVRLLESENPEQFDERLRAFCQGRLQRFKVPVLVEVGELDHHSPRFKKARPVSGTSLDEGASP